MYPVYFFIAYLLLFLTIPVIWASRAAWLRARKNRLVKCPECRTREAVTCDPMFAVRQHLLGEDRELLVVNCSAWPAQAGCAQKCL
jgi:hypothetical protein